MTHDGLQLLADCTYTALIAMQLVLMLKCRDGIRAAAAYCWIATTMHHISHEIVTQQIALYANHTFSSKALSTRSCGQS
jgi:hypothetical protein